MARNRGGGWDDYEMERRMDEMEERRGYSDDYVFYVFIGIGLALFGIYLGLDWLDNQFGWETLDWFKDLLHIKK